MNYKEIKAMAQAWNTVQEAKFTFDIPEDIGTMERTAFHGAAAGAHKAGKSSFNFNGKKYPVTMKKDTAKAIADEVKPAVKKALAKASAASEKGKKAVTLPKAPFKMDEGMMDKVKSMVKKPKADAEKKAMDDFANVVSKAAPNKRAPKTAADAKALKDKRDADRRAKLDKALGPNAEDYDPYASSTKKEVQKADANKKIATARNAALKVARKMDEATATHKPNNGQEMDQGLSPSAKAQLANKTPMPDDVDGPTINKKSFDAMRKSLKTAPKRAGDNDAGDKAIKPSATPVKEDMNKVHTVDIDHTGDKDPAAKKHNITLKHRYADGYETDASGKKKDLQKYLAKHYGSADDAKENHPEVHKEAVMAALSVLKELSKKTLGSYVKKASSDNAVTNMAKGVAMATPNSDSKDSKKMGMDVGSLSKLSRKRKAGISTAVDKMTKETVMSADKKPEKFMKPDGKVGIRMVRTDKAVVDKDK